MIVSTCNNYSNCCGHGDVVELQQLLLRLRRLDVVKYDVVVKRLMEGPQEGPRVIVVVVAAAVDGEVAAVANEVDAVVFDVGGEAKTFH